MNRSEEEQKILDLAKAWVSIGLQVRAISAAASGNPESIILRQSLAKSSQATEDLWCACEDLWAAELEAVPN